MVEEKFQLKGRLEFYRYIVSFGAKQAAIFYELPKVVSLYRDAVFNYLKPEVIELLEPMPAYGGLLTSGLGPRIGSIVFHVRKKEPYIPTDRERLAIVPVSVRFGEGKVMCGTALFGNHDLEFIFGNSAKETAGKILEKIVAAAETD